jgi:hypothetical protein
MSSMNYNRSMQLITYSPGPNGGGRRGKHTVTLLIGSALYIGGYIFGYVMYPKYQTRIIKLHGNFYHQYEIQTRKYSGDPCEESIRVRNIECLRKIGYDILEPYQECESVFHNRWRHMAVIRAPENTTIEQLLADCKDCGTCVEANYSYDTIFGSYKTGYSIMDIHNSYQKTVFDELK